MKTKILVSIFFFSLISIAGFSQSAFQKGYIIKNNNDTIYGYINNNKGGYLNSIRCIFKKNLISEAKDYEPFEIKAYRIENGRFYVSQTIETDQAQEKRFLECLVNGILDVYFLSGERFFVSKDNGPLIELIKEEKTYTVDGKKHKRVSKKYIGSLKVILKDSPEIQKKIDNINGLTSKALIKIAKDYHYEVCKDEECIVYQKEEESFPKLKFQFGPLMEYTFLEAKSASSSTLKSLTTHGGFAISNYLNFNEDQYFKINHASYGFFAKINLPFLDERIFISYEGAFSKWNINETTIFNGTEYVGYQGTLNTKLKRNLFQSSIILHYEIRTKKTISPVIQLGFYNVSYSNKEYSRSFLMTFGDTPIEDDHQTISTSVSKSNNGMLFGIGAISKLKRVNFYLNLRIKESFNGISDDETDFDLKNSTYFNINSGIQISL